jgi:hypothetical protein
VVGVLFTLTVSVEVAVLENGQSATFISVAELIKNTILQPVLRLSVSNISQIKMLASRMGRGT